MAVERLDNDLDSLGGGRRTEERDLSLPPHSIQAEEAVLGSILKNPASIVRVSDFLKPEDFYQQRNKHVFRAMLSLFTDGKPIDYHSTADSLQQQGAYEASGGLLYLSELNLATPSAAHIEHYGRIVERMLARHSPTWRGRRAAVALAAGGGDERGLTVRPCLEHRHGQALAERRQDEDVHLWQ